MSEPNDQQDPERIDMPDQDAEPTTMAPPGLSPNDPQQLPEDEQSAGLAESDEDEPPLDSVG